MIPENNVNEQLDCLDLWFNEGQDQAVAGRLTELVDKQMNYQESGNHSAIFYKLDIWRAQIKQVLESLVKSKRSK